MNGTGDRVCLLEMCSAHEQQYGRPEPSCPACRGELE
jgi:hypothetical protein